MQRACLPPSGKPADPLCPVKPGKRRPRFLEKRLTCFGQSHRRTTATLEKRGAQTIFETADGYADYGLRYIQLFGCASEVENLS